MYRAIRYLDRLLNKYTMYRGLLYGLAGLFVVAEVFTLTGAISLSAVGILVSLISLTIACYVTNFAFSKFLHIPRNAESWLITALILVFVLPPATTLNRALLVALTGAIAMASKYVLTFRKTHIFNPAAAGAFVVSVTALLPSTWWVANPVMAPFVALMVLTVCRKHRNFYLFFSFAITATALLVFSGSVLHDQPVLSVLKSAVNSWPILFFGSVMLTEPMTMPATKYYRVLFAVLVGAVFASQLHVGPVTATPQAALIIGNIFAVLFEPARGLLLRFKERKQLATDIYEMVFEQPGKRLAFSPGQYMYWTLPHAHVDERGNRRTFSIASSPQEPDIKLGFRTYEPGSSYKKALLAMKPGQHIRASHVAGSFTLPNKLDEPLLFIAGGVGMTPFRSMLATMAKTGQKRDVVLLYFAAKKDEFVYRDVIAAAGAKVVYRVGRVTSDELAQLVPDFHQRLTYISGPEGMVSGYKHLLRSSGVSSRRIHTDHFSGY